MIVFAIYCYTITIDGDDLCTPVHLGLAC